MPGCISICNHRMEPETPRQAQTVRVPMPMVGRSNLVTPNPKLKLLEQVREVMRLKHYAGDS